MKTLVVLVLTLCAFAQDPQKPVPQRDSAAVRRLEVFDAKVYTPVAAGLRELTFEFPMPETALPGLVLDISWKTPDATQVTARVTDKAPASARQQMQLLADLINDPKRAEGQEFRTNAHGVAKQVIGESLAAKLAGDDLATLSESEVKVTARSEASRRQFKEQVLTFDAKGLVTKATVTAPNGLVTVIETTWTEKSNRWFQSSVAMSVGKERKSIAFEYGDVGGFTLLQKMTASDGKNASEVLEVRRPRANAPTSKPSK